MKKYIAFLRAINVGGTKIIKMEDLKKMFESFGVANIQTYIQSGNVIFESHKDDIQSLEKDIEIKLETALGYRIETFLRTMDELKAIANKPAFVPTRDETLHISFLRHAPDKKSTQELMDYKSKADDFAVKGREVYNLRRDRDNSVFSNQFIEKIMGLPGTTRNLNTVRKIVEKFA